MQRNIDLCAPCEWCSPFYTIYTSRGSSAIFIQEIYYAKKHEGETELCKVNTGKVLPPCFSSILLKSIYLQRPRLFLFKIAPRMHASNRKHLPFPQRAYSIFIGIITSIYPHLVKQTLHHLLRELPYHTSKQFASPCPTLGKWKLLNGCDKTFRSHVNIILNFPWVIFYSAHQRCPYTFIETQKRQASTNRFVIRYWLTKHHHL